MPEPTFTAQSLIASSPYAPVPPPTQEPFKFLRGIGWDMFRVLIHTPASAPYHPADLDRALVAADPRLHSLGKEHYDVFCLDTLNDKFHGKHRGGVKHASALERRYVAKKIRRILQDRGHSPRLAWRLGRKAAGVHWRFYAGTPKDRLNCFLGALKLYADVVGTTRHLRAAGLKQMGLSAWNHGGLEPFEGEVKSEAPARDHDLTAQQAILEVVWTSGQIGVRKPEPRGYFFLLRELGLPAETVVFVDDTLRNVVAAMACGMQGVWLRRPEHYPLTSPEEIPEGVLVAHSGEELLRVVRDLDAGLAARQEALRPFVGEVTAKAQAYEGLPRITGRTVRPGVVPLDAPKPGNVTLPASVVSPVPVSRAAAHGPVDAPRLTAISR